MQTENILKFLSYAGPRLDYLEKRAAASMEKQALSPKFLRAAYEAASKLPADRQARLKNIMSLKFDGKTLTGEPTITHVSPTTGKLIQDVYDGDNVAQRIISGNGSAQSYNPRRGNIQAVLDAQAQRAKATPETPAPTPTPKAPAPAGSWWNDIVTAHPIAAPATTAGVTGAAAGGFGYGIGNANGKDDGAKMAQHYIMMQNLIEQLREQKNKGFFSGLSNFLA